MQLSVQSSALKLDFGVALTSVSLCFDALVCLTSTVLFRLLSCFLSPPPSADLWLQWHPWIIPINGNVLGGRSNYFSGATAPVISRVSSPGLYFL